ncbi:MAG: hypothetical protein J0I07_14775, partial [Myxococcales bacterium]|nr:hypothetical protein [Myxococcales bacterium]
RDATLTTVRAHAAQQGTPLTPSEDAAALLHQLESPVPKFTALGGGSYELGVHAGLVLHRLLFHWRNVDRRPPRLDRGFTVDAPFVQAVLDTIDWNDTRTRTALMELRGAAPTEGKRMMRELLRRGAPLDIPEVFVLACEFGFFREVSKQVAQCGGHVVAKRFFYETTEAIPALSAAVRGDQLKIVQLLLAHGARPQSSPFTNPNWYSPLHHVCSAAVTRALLDAGADLNDPANTCLPFDDYLTDHRRFLTVKASEAAEILGLLHVPLSKTHVHYLQRRENIKDLASRFKDPTPLRPLLDAYELKMPRKTQKKKKK